MPFPLLAAIGAATGLANTLLGNASTQKANRESMQFQEHMYDRQRADALADWNRNNEYNSPMAQMARLKGAGLNPALFYGGGSGAIQTAQPIRSSSPGSYRAEAYKPDLSPIVNGAMDVLLKKEQVKNLQAQNDLVHAQAEETRSRIPKNQAETSSTEFDVGMKRKLESVNIAIRNNDLTKLYADTEKVYNDIDMARQRNIREIATSNQDIKLKVAETAKIIAETKNVKLTSQEIVKRIESMGLDNKLKEIELQWKRAGYTSHDSLPFRVITDVGNGIADILKKLFE